MPYWKRYVVVAAPGFSSAVKVTPFALGANGAVPRTAGGLAGGRSVLKERSAPVVVPSALEAITR